GARAARRGKGRAAPPPAVRRGEAHEPHAVRGDELDRRETRRGRDRPPLGGRSAFRRELVLRKRHARARREIPRAPGERRAHSLVAADAPVFSIFGAGATRGSFASSTARLNAATSPSRIAL